MFTGIVTATGTVRQARLRAGVLDLEIEAPAMSKELKPGDSVALNGVCLTITRSSRKRFSTQAMEETLARSTLGNIERGQRVNLELPARPIDRLGGHLVQGHVDGIARAIRVEEEEGARRVWFSTDDGLLRYLVAKGSVALDGVSLTVVEVGRTSFQVALIAHTLGITTLRDVDVGRAVNVEVDVIAKYVERLAAGLNARRE